MKANQERIEENMKVEITHTKTGQEEIKNAITL